MIEIQTFSNQRGGNPFFKAIGHPWVAGLWPDFLARLSGRRVAIYDPWDHARDLVALYDLERIDVRGYFVQDLSHIGTELLGEAARPVTELAKTECDVVLIAAFDAGRLASHIAHLLPTGVQVISLDDGLRLPEDMVGSSRPYLSPLNFATNFAFFREGKGTHTRLVTADYWSGYGARSPELWCCLFDTAGAVLAEWRERLPGAGGSVSIDSADLRRRFGLGEFTGQLFLHVLKAAGHDVVKYALDTYGDEATDLSCTHDANAWPSEYFAGLPAPADDERVTLWVQNSHPRPIPAKGLGLNVMGREEVAWLRREVPGFATLALDTREVLPEACWPQQIEIKAGKHCVRPRYEVVAGNGRRRIAHVNVERVDLGPDPQIPELSASMGKGYILSAPLPPGERFETTVLPTPMATGQSNLPLAILAYDPEGRELTRHRLGKLPRDHARAVVVADLIETEYQRHWGHLELVYDFTEGGDADGWLHAICRYRDKNSGHVAETSFGSHIFNSVLTYRSEPQSYAGRPPGLSTRLFLRVGAAPYDTFCQLIYPASTPWHAKSETRLALINAVGEEVAAVEREIACNGSLFFRVSETFRASDLAAAEGGYVLVRDLTCRLFGYHGLMREETSFSLDHMFGF